MNTIDKVLKVAKSQVGYLEKKSNSLLDSFKENAGKKNFTKYAREYQKFAGVNLQGQAWCDMFVDFCFVIAFGKEIAKKLLGNFSAYTPTSAQYFKNMKQWHTAPRIGDVIFFKNSERINHTGIVTEVSNTKVYTIEGNTSDGEEIIPNGGGVCEKSYILSNSRIAGYGRPNYDYAVPLKTITDKSSYYDVIWLQMKLNKAFKALNIDLQIAEDGKYGKQTRQAVIKYYTLQGWKSEGIKVGIYGKGRLSKY